MNPGPFASKPGPSDTVGICGYPALKMRSLSFVKNDNILDIFSQIKYVIKVDSPPPFFFLSDVAGRKFRITHVTHIPSLSDSSV